MTHDERRDATVVSNAHGATTARRYEWTAFGRPSTAIVEGVADVTGCDPVDVSLSDHHLDAETLDALVASGGDVSVSLTLDDAEVTIESGGTLEVRSVGTESDRVRPRSSSELNERLRRLLDGAFENGVDVVGGWTIRNESVSPDWDVHVTEVTKPYDEGAPAAEDGDIESE